MMAETWDGDGDLRFRIRLLWQEDKRVGILAARAST